MAKDRADLTYQAFKIKINNTWTYIEDVITGYASLNSTGRESVVKAFECYDDTKADGSRLKYSRMTAREIEIECMLTGNDPSDLLAKYELLTKTLNVENAEIIFNDEADKYIVGSFVFEEGPEKFQSVWSGKFKIICTDPFKYSTTETTVQTATVTDSVTDENDVTYSITSLALSTTNDGGYKTFPKFEVQFATDENASGQGGSDADCGYVLFAKKDTNYSIQAGSDQETDGYSSTTYNQDFTVARGSYSDSNGLAKPSTKHLYQGSSKVQTDKSKGLKANSYSSEASKKFYGPCVSYSIPVAVPGSFEFTFKSICCCNKTTSKGKVQGGTVLCLMYDSNNAIKYGVGLQKTDKTSLKATNVYYNDGLKTESTQSVSYDSSSKAKTGIIRRFQDSAGNWKLYVQFGAYSTEYALGDSVEQISRVAFFFGKYSSIEAFYTNRITSAKLVTGDFNYANTFGSKDFLEIDTGKAEIKLNNASRSDIGDYANNWEDMYLDTGTNVIYVQWSDFVTAGYEPTVTMKYRKRWL